MTHRSRPRRLALLVATFALVAGCGDEPPAPSDDVPALGTTLDRVDDAIVAGQYDDARTALDELVATTRTALEEGELGRVEADRILAAAAQLSSALPEEQVEEPTEEPEPSEEPTEEPEPTEPTEEPTPTEEEPSEEDAEKEEEKEQKEEEKLQEELEKEAEKEAEDPGNSGENGSDNGEGND